MMVKEFSILAVKKLRKKPVVGTTAARKRNSVGIAPSSQSANLLVESSKHAWLTLCRGREVKGHALSCLGRMSTNPHTRIPRKTAVAIPVT